MMDIEFVYDFLQSNEITSTILTIFIMIFILAMFFMPFYVFRIYSRLGEVIKLQEEAKKRSLKDRELRNPPRDLN